MVAQAFIEQGHAISQVLDILNLPRSSYYYTPTAVGQRGRPKSTRTRIQNEGWVSNACVVEHIKEILGREFVDYGYLKVTHALRQEHDFQINKKKVYRLMKQAGLLYNKSVLKLSQRLWVKELVPKPLGHFSYLEFDIKYLWIAGKRRNAMVLSVIDVSSRWLLGHVISFSICKHDIVKLFDDIFASYPMPEEIFVRNDNGSQMESILVQEYFVGKGVTQEFTHPATPEQNAHIESYHSIMERVICRRYEFEHLEETISTFDRWITFYNYDRIHSGTNFKSPYQNLLDEEIDMKKELELKASSNKGALTEPPN